MTDIIKELDKAKEERLANGDEFLKKSQLLLGENANKEAELLHAIGLDLHLNKVEKEREMAIVNAKHEEKYEMKPYNYSEIKALGVKYRLKFAVASLYRGNIPPDLGAVVLRLKEKHDLDVGKLKSNTDAGRFFVLAPPVMFKDYQSIGDKIMDAGKDAAAEMKTLVEKKVDPDPVLFYKVDNDHYILLKKWGTDFTAFRAVLGFLSRNWFFPIVGMLVLPFLWLTMIGKAACWLWIYTLDNVKDKAGNWTGFPVWGLVCILAYVVFAFATLLFFVEWGHLLFGSSGKRYSITRFVDEARWVK